MRPETPTRHLSGGTQDPAAQVSLQFEEGAALELGLRVTGTETMLKSGRGDPALPPAQRGTRMEAGPSTPGSDVGEQPEGEAEKA